MNSIEVSGVFKTYGTVSVLKDFALTLGQGETLAVTGPSGCGKSTLLHLLGAMDVPDRGTIRINGTEIAGLTEEGRRVFRKNEIGFVFQHHFLLPHLTVFENVLVPAWGPRMESGLQDRARDLLRQLGIDHRADHLPGQVSGGECQRAAVARALLMRPRLILADEPTGALDPESAAALKVLFLDVIRQTGASLVTATHDFSFAESFDHKRSLCPTSSM